MLSPPAAAMAQMQAPDMPEQFGLGQPAEESAATQTIHVESHRHHAAEIRLHEYPSW